MAKRKRLEIPDTGSFSPELETKSIFPAPRVRMPIADVAGDTAGRAALEEVAREMTVAEEEGRVVKRLPIDRIVTMHLNRDRLSFDPAEMETLKASLLARGQQAPIEVLSLGRDYGLISGLRRVEALKALGKTDILALVRRPESAAGAYQAMVEENEIRSDLSFFERANIAVLCAGQGVYRTPREAVAALFAHAPAPKRSKINKFVILCQSLGKSLRFPAAIPEKLGLRLAAAIEVDRSVASRLSDALRKTPPVDAAAERRTIERALKGREGGGTGEAVLPGIDLRASRGRAVLAGPGVDDAFLDALRIWMLSRAKA